MYRKGNENCQYIVKRCSIILSNPVHKWKYLKNSISCSSDWQNFQSLILPGVGEDIGDIQTRKLWCPYFRTANVYRCFKE